MIYKIELSDREISGFINFLNDQIKSNFDIINEKIAENKSLEDRVEKLKKELSSNLGNTDQQIKGLTFNDFTYPDGYSPSMLWIDKVKYILKMFPKGLTTSHIIDELIKIEPKYSDDRKTAVRSISATVSAKSKSGGELQRVTNFRNEFVYSIKPEEVNEVILVNNNNNDDEDLPF